MAGFLALAAFVCAASLEGIVGDEAVSDIKMEYARPVSQYHQHHSSEEGNSDEEWSRSKEKEEERIWEKINDGADGDGFTKVIEGIGHTTKNGAKGGMEVLNEVEGAKFELAQEIYEEGKDGLKNLDVDAMIRTAEGNWALDEQLMGAAANGLKAEEGAKQNKGNGGVVTGSPHTQEKIEVNTEGESADTSKIILIEIPRGQSHESESREHHDHHFQLHRGSEESRVHRRSLSRSQSRNANDERMKSCSH